MRRSNDPEQASASSYTGSDGTGSTTSGSGSDSDYSPSPKEATAGLTSEHARQFDQHVGRTAASRTSPVTAVGLAQLELVLTEDELESEDDMPQLPDSVPPQMGGAFTHSSHGSPFAVIAVRAPTGRPGSVPTPASPVGLGAAHAAVLASGLFGSYTGSRGPSPVPGSAASRAPSTTSVIGGPHIRLSTQAPAIPLARHIAASFPSVQSVGRPLQASESAVDNTGRDSPPVITRTASPSIAPSFTTEAAAAVSGKPHLQTLARTQPHVMRPRSESEMEPIIAQPAFTHVVRTQPEVATGRSGGTVTNSAGVARHSPAVTGENNVLVQLRKTRNMYLSHTSDATSTESPTHSGANNSAKATAAAAPPAPPPSTQPLAALAVPAAEIVRSASQASQLQAQHPAGAAASGRGGIRRPGSSASRSRGPSPLIPHAHNGVAASVGPAQGIARGPSPAAAPTGSSSGDEKYWVGAPRHTTFGATAAIATVPVSAAQAAQVPAAASQAAVARAEEQAVAVHEFTSAGHSSEDPPTSTRRRGRKKAPRKKLSVVTSNISPSSATQPLSEHFADDGSSAIVSPASVLPTGQSQSTESTAQGDVKVAVAEDYSVLPVAPVTRSNRFASAAASTRMFIAAVQVLLGAAGSLAVTGIHFYDGLMLSKVSDSSRAAMNTAHHTAMLALILSGLMWFAQSLIVTAFAPELVRWRTASPSSCRLAVGTALLIIGALSVFALGGVLAGLLVYSDCHAAPDSDSYFVCATSITPFVSGDITLSTEDTLPILSKSTVWAMQASSIAGGACQLLLVLMSVLGCCCSALSCCCTACTPGRKARSTHIRQVLGGAGLNPDVGRHGAAVLAASSEHFQSSRYKAGSGSGGGAQAGNGKRGSSKRHGSSIYSKGPTSSRAGSGSGQAAVSTTVHDLKLTSVTSLSSLDSPV